MKAYQKQRKARNNMGCLEQKELNKLRNEKRASVIKLNADKELFAQQLQNGLGEEIKEELRNPRKPSGWVKFKVKWAKFKLLLKERLMNIEVK